MRIVAIDTTESEGSVGLLEPGVARELRFAAGKGHGPHVLLALRELLAGAPLQSVDLWVAGAGPGSFTGVRVALSTVRAFAFAFGRPATAVSTTRALAHAATTQARWVAPLIDARKGEVYAALYERDGESLVERVAPFVAKAPAALERLRQGVEAQQSLTPVYDELTGARERGGEPGRGALLPRPQDEITGARERGGEPGRGALLPRPQDEITYVGSGCVLAGVSPSGANGISALAMAALVNPAPPWPPASPLYVRPPEAEIKFGPAPPLDVMASLVD